MISGQKQSCSFVTLQINAGRHDYLAGINVLRAMNNERTLRRARQPTTDMLYIEKRSPLVRLLASKVFWVLVVLLTQLVVLKFI